MPIETALVERTVPDADAPAEPVSQIDASIARFLATRPVFTDEMRDRVSSALAPSARSAPRQARRARAA